MPRVSVIIPTYNRADVLSRALQSVLDQTYRDFELIVIDDGSIDETREVVERFTDERVRYIWQENQERSVARNTGIRASRGEYVSFLDSDDEYLSHKLAVQVPILDHDPEIGMVLSGWQETDGRGLTQEVSPWLARPSLKFSLEDWLLSPPVHFCVSLVRRVWLEKVGGFDPQMVLAEDIDLWFRLIRAGCQPAWVKTHVLKHHTHDGDLSGCQQSYRYLLEKAFADPELSSLIGISKDEINGRAYVAATLRAYRSGRARAGRDNLVQAIRLLPDLLAREGEQVLEAIVTGAWRPVNDDPVAYVQRVFGDLPDDLGELHRRRKWALARAWMAAAFRAHREGKGREVIKAVLYAVCLEKKLVLNRGLISIGLEALVGSRIMRSIRSLRRRLFFHGAT